MKKITNPYGKRGKGVGELVDVRLTLPAHINEAVIKFQDSEELRGAGRPAKAEVMLRALTEFLATRISPAVVLLLTTGCQREHLDYLVSLCALMALGVLFTFIFFQVKDNNK